MALIDELKEKRIRRINNWDAWQAQISEHQAALREIEVDIADLDTAIAALEPETCDQEGLPTEEDVCGILVDGGPSIDHTEPESGLRAAEDVWTPEGLEQLSADAKAFTDSLGAPQIEPETGLHGEPEPTELDAEPVSVLDNPELLAAVERAEATLAAEPAAYVGLNDPELDDAWDAMKAREEAEKTKPRFSIFGRIKEDA